MTADSGPSLTRFGALLRRLGAVSEGTDLHAALTAAWAEPHRVYHGTAHLADCLRALDLAPSEGGDPDTAEAALWFHDVVYDPRAADNEERSAEWAAQGLAHVGVPAGTAGEVARLVRLTRHAEAPVPSDATGALVCDVDLSVLGRAAADYEAFERGIRAEYAWVPEPVYRAERSRILARLLAREPLYLTTYFRQGCESAARSNLNRAIERLRS